MSDTQPQTADGKVLWHFTMSLDGFVAGPDHQMGWMVGQARPGLAAEYVRTTGAVLGGRDGWDAASGNRPYGGAWDGPVFVLTHHPEDGAPADGVTFLDCAPDEAAGGRNVEVFSPSIGRQLLDLGLIDEIALHIAPVCSATASGCSTIPTARRSACTGSATTTSGRSGRPLARAQTTTEEGQFERRSSPSVVAESGDAHERRKIDLRCRTADRRGRHEPSDHQCLRASGPPHPESRPDDDPR